MTSRFRDLVDRIEVLGNTKLPELRKMAEDQNEFLSVRQLQWDRGKCIAQIIEDEFDIFFSDNEDD